MKKHSIILFLYYILTTSSYGVSGISSKKLIIPSANVLDHGNYEVDFNFYWLKTKNYYSEQGKLKSFELKCSQESCKKNKIYEGGLSFRFSTGLGNQSEIGFESGLITTQKEILDFTFSYIDDLKFGFKQNLYNKNFYFFFKLVIVMIIKLLHLFMNLEFLSAKNGINFPLILIFIILPQKEF